MSENTPVETVLAPRPLAPEPTATRANTPGGSTDAPPPGDASSRPLVAGYELTHEIARGGMGVVYAARDLAFGRTVAVKTTLPSASDESFVREAEITARLQHPGIPPVHALGTLPDGRPFLAMKLISGRTLDRVLKARADPGTDRPRLLAAFEYLCQAVGYAHAQGVIHRDLKPGNVMVGAFGEVQVMDWGLAKEVRSAALDGRTATAPELPGSALDTPPSEETFEGSAKGTPTYMAPEQARGEWANVGPRADVFALGGILCAILTGKSPFAAGTGREAIDRARRADLSDAFARLDASGADGELVALARRCLSARAEDRFADGTAVAQAVGEYRARADERLHRAERDRAAAEARAVEEANTRREAEARAEAERAARAAQRKKARAQLLLACAAVLLVAAGGAFAWYSADREAKAAQLEGDKKASDARAQAADEFKTQQARQGIDANLKLSASLRKVYKFKEAEAALALAAELARTGAPERADEVRRAQTDLALVVKLDDVRYRKWVIFLNEDGTAVDDTKRAPAEYRKALAAFGFDFASGPVDAGAARVAASGARAEVVAALDDWALFEPDASVRDRLLEVARRADPGPWLERLRAPTGRTDAAHLLALATDPAARAVAPAALTALTTLMLNAGLDPVPVLVAARHAHPDDFELAFFLGQLLMGDAGGRQFGPLEAARALRPDNTTVLNNTAIEAHRTGDRAAGGALLRRLVELAPDFAHGHYNFGQALRLAGDHAGAARAFARYAELVPGDNKGHYNVAAALCAAGDPKGGIAAYRRAIALAPNHATSHNNLGNALRASGDPVAAEAAYRRALELDPNDARAHANLSTVLSDRGDRIGALKAVRRAIELDPNLSDAHYNLGCRLLNGDPKGAARAFRKTIELVPGHAKAHTNLGVALREIGDFDGALVAYRRALELDPKDALAHLGLGSTLADTGDTAGALTATRKAVELDPNNAIARYNLGIVLGAGGKLDDAIAAYRKALELQPKYPEARTNLGIALAAKGKTDEAIAEYRKALALDDTVSPAHYNLGLALRTKGDLAGAASAFRRATELEPRFAQGHIDFAMALIATGDTKGALAAFRRGLEFFPQAPELHTNLGIVHLQRGENAEAAKAARGAITVAPNYAHAHAVLGTALKRLGDIPGARAAFTEAARLDKKWANGLLLLPKPDVAPPPRAKP